MEDPYVKDQLDHQGRAAYKAMIECVATHGVSVLQEVMKPTYNESTESYTCPAYWDSILCWPDSLPGTQVTKSCPDYIKGFKMMHNATRMCADDGVWAVKVINSTFNVTWTNYTDCFDGDMVTFVVNSTKFYIPEILERSVPIIAIISKIGYIVSLVSLVIAFGIMLSIKKLHCTRNILHMHLFASFILRAFIIILKGELFVENIGLNKDLYQQNGFQYFYISVESTKWECKLLTSLFQYSITANYSWILMEGLYLHNLIFRALFADSNNNIRSYVILGWGCPLVIVSLWVGARIMFENDLCWTGNDNFKVFLITAVPTMISILINFVFFMRISKVLYSKLRAPVNEDSRRYRKWMKSTLVLVPLFGVHYALFLCLYFVIKVSYIVELIWLIGETSFASFQGFFVAVLYCFMNATNKFSKLCFPCRKKFLRSIVGRSSVCTTMSCSSVYTNGIIHRNSKTKLDSSLPKTKHHLQLEKNTNNALRSLQDLSSSRWNSKSHQCRNQSDLHPSETKTISETTLCLEPVLIRQFDEDDPN